MKLSSSIAVAVGLGLGFALSFAAPALATRNSSGTYTLPAGNPVVTGTTISSTTHNTTMSDVATEITDSLSRSGKGGMTAPLELADGTVSLPAVTFDSDPDNGLYRVSANTPGMTAGGTKIQEWTSTGGPSTTVSQAFIATDGGVVTVHGATNQTAWTVTGAGSGNGLTATGGATGSGCGCTAGGGNLHGLGAVGAGSGSGAIVVGGASAGAGITATGGATGGVGGVFANQTAASGGTRRDAVTLSNGDIDLSGVTDATSTTSISDRVTPSNVVKAWGKIATGTPHTVLDGFNLASVANDASNNGITVTIAADLANNDYAVVVGARDIFIPCYTASHAVGAFDILCAYQTAFTPTFADVDLNTVSAEISFIVVGKQ